MSPKPASVPIAQLTLDEFVARERIRKVHLLKIDTEGYELRVLEGSESLFNQRKVEILVAEVFFVKYRKGQAFFWDLASWLNSFGYLFYGLFDTRQTTQGRLYTGNGIWVSPDVGHRLGFF